MEENNMEWFEIISGILTLIAGGGWFLSYKAYKRKTNGEATQSEADGWKSMQDVYQQTIDDLNKYCNDIRTDRNLLHDENISLREENRKLREKYIDMEKQILELKKELARQGRKLESVLPFTCAVVACPNRTRVELQQDIEQEEN